MTLASHIKSIINVKVVSYVVGSSHIFLVKAADMQQHKKLW